MCGANGGLVQCIMAETMVERVAAALERCLSAVPEDQARAAIEAMREPTRAMAAASIEPSDHFQTIGTATNCWVAMVDAALAERPPGGATPAWDSRTSPSVGGPTPCPTTPQPIGSSSAASPAVSGTEPQKSVDNLMSDLIVETALAWFPRWVRR